MTKRKRNPVAGIAPAAPTGAGTISGLTPVAAVAGTRQDDQAPRLQDIVDEINAELDQDDQDDDQASADDDQASADDDQASADDDQGEAEGVPAHVAEIYNDLQPGEFLLVYHAGDELVTAHYETIDELISEMKQSRAAQHLENQARNQAEA